MYRPGLRLSLIIAATLVSGLCFLRPDMNAFALMASSIPGLFILYHEGIRSVCVCVCESVF